MKILTLGPSGSFSSAAARKFDAKAEIFFESTNANVVRTFMKSKQYDYAIIPIENTTNGIVRESLDAMYEYRPKIYSGLTLDIHYCLAAQSAKFSKILSHPQALAQCRDYLYKNYPKIHLEGVASTAYAAELAAESSEFAALVSELAAKEYKLKIIKRKIEDTKNNKTKFLILGRKENPKKQKYTSLVIKPNLDCSGLLLKLLMPFSYLDINLTRIESRPVRGEMGSYLFYLDCEGDFRDPKIKEVVKILNTGSLAQEVYLFGSYS